MSITGQLKYAKVFYWKNRHQDMLKNAVTDPYLLRQHADAGQRYACYPGNEYFSTSFDVSLFDQQLRARHVAAVQRPLALHVPVGATSGAANDADYIRRELALICSRVAPDRIVAQLYYCVDAKGVDDVIRAITGTAELKPQEECVIEAELHGLTRGRLEQLVALEFSRLRVVVRNGISSGDTDLLTDVAADARAAGFGAIDIIWELPGMEADAFQHQLERIDALNPDRVVLRTRAPSMSVDRQMHLLEWSLSALESDGYVYLGMGHFVRTNDALAIARTRGRLHYDVTGNFSGVERDWIGLGVAAVSALGPVYVQNERDPAHYRSALDAGRLPIERGLQLTRDDLMRRSIIQALICNSVVSFESIDIAYIVDFREYFAPELAMLVELESRGIVEVSDESIVITPRGRLVAPAVYALFDGRSTVTGYVH